MILLLSSLSLAQTTIHVGPSEEFDSIYEALDANREAWEAQGVEVVLEAGYDPSSESFVGATPLGLAFDHDVIIRSSVDGELRPAPFLHFMEGTKVELYDLDIVGNGAGTYTVPGNSGEGSFDKVGPLLIRDTADFYAKGVVIQGIGSLTGTHVHIHNASATFEECRFVDNAPGVAGDSPFEYLNYVVSLRNDGLADLRLSFIDTEISVTPGSAGGGIFMRNEEASSATLIMQGGEISKVTSQEPGSALRLLNYNNTEFNTQVEGLRIRDAQNTAVRLGQGQHVWLALDVDQVNGSKGGAFAVSDSGNLTLGGFFKHTTADFGALVHLKPGTSLLLAAANMQGGGANYAGAVYGSDVFLKVHNSRFCDVQSESLPLLYTSQGVELRNTVFRNLSGGMGALQAGGDLDLVNNTFVDIDGPILTGPSSDLHFRNNAVVRVDRVVKELGAASLDLGYNLYFDNLIDLPGEGLSVAENSLVDTDPKFWADYLADSGNCAVDPYPATDSPLVSAGDPDIKNPDGTPSDIGAFGGPLAEDWRTVVGSGDTVVLLGGCGSSGVALLLLPLLGLGRRRR